MRKAVRFFFAVILSLTVISFPIILHGQDSSSSSSSSNESASDDIKKRIAELEQKLANIHQQKNTLSSQIQEMDTQIFLKTLNIQQTEQKITATQHEIDMLGARITGLDTSLASLSKLLIQRVVKGYKEKTLSVFDLLLGTENMGDFVNRIKYQRTTRDNNQKLLVQVQEAKSNYEEQKTLRETKKLELDQLIETLQIQKQQLIYQQDAKRNLLAATNNDESTYQKLLEKARQELAGYASFVQNAGGGCLSSNSSGSNGWYYSQCNSNWAILK